MLNAASCTQTARLVAGNIQTALTLGEFLFEVPSLCHSRPWHQRITNAPVRARDTVHI